MQKKSGGEGTGKGVFSVALALDGALTWDVPPPVEEDGIIIAKTSRANDSEETLKESGDTNPKENGDVTPEEVIKARPVDFSHAYEGCRIALSGASRDHLVKFVKQLLCGLCVEGRDEWLPVLVDIALSAAQCLDLSAARTTGIVDPREYVKVECVPGVSEPKESQVIHGMVLRKNRAHRRMQSKLPNPRLLLLSGPLEFETSATTLLQLNSAYLSRGKEYLDAVASKIVSCRPDVVLVEKNVARAAIEKLNEEGIILVYNVQLPQLEMLAQCTGAEVVNLKSVSEVKQSSMGRCEEFAVMDVIRKPTVVGGRMKRAVLPPLMIFKGCQVPLVCTAVLYGDTPEQLDKLSRVVKQSIFAAYHMRLESAFLADELSVASSAMAAVAEGFPVDAGLDLWRDIGHEFVCKSVQGVAKWRSSRPIHSLSPHVSGWWASEARHHISQSKEYVTPVFMGRKRDPAAEGEDAYGWEDTDDSENPWEDNSDFVCDARSDVTEEKRSEVGEKNEEVGDWRPKRNGVISLFGQPAGGALGKARMGKRSLSTGCLRGLKSGGQEEAVSPEHRPSAESADADRLAMCDGEEMRTREQVGSSGEVSTSGRVRSKVLHVMEEPLRFTSSIAIRNHRRGLMCEPHHLHSIDFYDSDSDRSLSSFLMSIAADSEKRCPHDCHGGNSSHVRTFLHGGMRITMSVVSLPPDKELQNSGQLWFWARPKGLGRQPLATVRRVLLSPDAMRVSFGAFLDLSCNSNFLQVFDRQLHLEFVRYFGYGRTVACVYQDRFQPYELHIPPRELCYSNDNQLMWMTECGNELMQEANEAYTAVEKALQVSQEQAGDGHASRESYVHKTLVRDIHQEHTEFTEKLKRIIRHARKGGVDKRSNLVNFDEVLLDCALELNGLRKDLAVNVLAWAKFMSDPTQQNPPTVSSKASDLDADLLPRRQSEPLPQTPKDPPEAPPIHREGTDPPPDAESVAGAGGDRQDSVRNEDGGPEAIETRNSGGEGSARASTPEGECMVASHRLGSADGPLDSTSDQPVGSEASELGEDEGGWVPLRSPFAEAPFLIRPFSPDGVGIDRGEEEGGGASRRRDLMATPPGELRRVGAIPPIDTAGSRKLLHKNSSASNLIDIFNSEAEKFRAAGEAIGESSSADGGDGGDGPPSHRRCSSDPFSPREEPLVHQLTRRLVSGFSSSDLANGVDGDLKRKSEPVPELARQVHPLEVNANNSTPFLSRARSHKSSEPGMVPLSVGQVFLNGRSLITAGQCTSGGDEVVIPVFDDEPGSVIAHVLASISFQKKLQQEVAAMQALHWSAGERAEPRPHERRSSWDGKPPAEGPQGTGRRASDGVARVPRSDAVYWHPAHITQRFEDDALEMMPLSKARFDVVAYFAPQFAKLRSRCIPGGEKSFIMSLSRCKLWRARGGKTKAYFGRTMDERYVIKSMSAMERDSFLRHLAPNYLKYIDDAIDAGRDICLAKILGMFQVSLKSRTEEWERTVIIMENVFYDRTCIRKYDLKGSKRGRDNPEAERSYSRGEEAVFLDNDLRRHNLQAPPLLVDQRNLDCLQDALNRDTKFLADLAIMDYSLILGLDKERTKLVVGIIDFVREYTLDKRFETLIKSSGILGEGGSEPTIISPNAYRTRFVEEIRKYFTVVPTHDDWEAGAPRRGAEAAVCDGC
ncbi:unnamed protein product [Ostreobium quekettii]|uniref:1-phosphatidylinositol-3-phosphate 5-kinase n=1 Tax=Ostreobium quekettii TaxID=121088 RepID=A0A8S1J1J0_9CHLO|nr:unnamed protein product [Ostreobium quekettii]